LEEEYKDLFGNYGEGAATQDVLNGTFVVPDSATESTLLPRGHCHAGQCQQTHH